jgi:hypothetical protein
MDYIMIILGIGALALSAVGPRLTAADPISGAGFKSERELPRWLGRLLCLVAGIMFIVIGLVPLLSK